MNFGRVVIWLAFALVLGLGACSEKGPYLDISGGGFIFNYRLSEAYAGFVAGPRRTLPEHSRIEATFENPSGGPPIVLSKDVTPDRREYSFTTDALHGIKANIDYDVTVRLIGADGKVIETIDKKLHSDLDQSVLADKPLTIGPGYTPNPDLAPSGQ
jgi:hypothetical protein